VPRKRTIDPDLWTDDRVQALPTPLAILLYIGMISQADDDGRFEWNARQLFARVFALRDDVKLRDVEQAMAAISECGLVQVYSSAGRSFAAHPAWRKHQYISRPTKSKIPEPPCEDSRSPHVQTPGAAPGLTESLREDSRSPHVPSVSGTGTVSGTDTAASQPSGASAREDEPLDDGELDLGSGRSRSGPALDFARWFVTAAVAAKALPAHVGLTAADVAYREAVFAEPLVATYPRTDLEARSQRLFARKTDPTDPLRSACSIKTLAERWDWFAAESRPAQVAPNGVPAPVDRSVDVPDVGATW
jgi:hypothetical protein